MGNCGDCGLPSQQQMQAHELYCAHNNDKDFVNSSSEFQLLLGQLQEDNLQTLRIKKEQLKVQQQDLLLELKRAEVKVQEIKNTSRLAIRQKERPRIIIEVRKGRNIPDTAGCRRSRPYASLKVQPLNEMKRTRTSDCYIPK